MISRATLATCAAACLLAGCGSGTRTVSVGSTAPDTGASSTPSTAKRQPAGATPAGHSPAGGGTPSSKSTSSGAATAGGTAAPSSGSSGSGPAFLNQGGGGLSAAEAVVRNHGYAPLDTGQYRSDQTLRVLVAARAGSADNHVQQAFFFAGGRYLGTDTSVPSANIQVVGQSDTEVTLSYALYRHGDPLCCPTGGHTRVRYQLDNGRLAALDPIPAADAGSAASGRQ